MTGDEVAVPEWEDGKGFWISRKELSVAGNYQQDFNSVALCYFKTKLQTISKAVGQSMDCRWWLVEWSLGNCSSSAPDR